MSPSRKIVVVGISLIALAALSFALSHMNLGSAALPVAIVIAICKAGLVVHFFMELSDARASAILAFASGVLLLALLLTLAVADVETRAAPPLLPPQRADLPRVQDASAHLS
ncbi:MAG: cytochrome C oxidase subunit IV family protein [Polyangiaceae bacterium]